MTGRPAAIPESSKAEILEEVIRILGGAGSPLKAVEMLPQLAKAGWQLDKHTLNGLLYGPAAGRVIEIDKTTWKWSLKAGVRPDRGVVKRPARGGSEPAKTLTGRPSGRASATRSGPVGQPTGKPAIFQWPAYGPAAPESKDDATRPTWTKEQLAVIEDAPTSRSLVVAGPGTGKTAVACARVAWLLDQGISPSNILMFSFTRAAVAEVRDRIEALAQGGATGAGAIRISTLDSAVWHLNKGLGDQEKDDRLFGSFEESIEAAVSMLKSGADDLREFLGRMEHVIVDEAQDLVGPRAELVVALLKALSTTCGITVFADPAQAIYGFSNDESDDMLAERPFHERFAEAFPGAVRSELTQLHRTRQKDLIRLFTEARKAVTSEAAGRLDRMYAVVQANAQPLARPLEEQELTDDHMVLFRRRSEVLQASSFISSKQEGARRVHRLRLSGLPQAIHPWVGTVLWDLDSPRLSSADFAARWRDRISTAMTDRAREHAWSVLNRFAGSRGGVIDTRVLRTLLSRPRPPIEFCVPDAGVGGPILGTIHASKGRQAPDVVLVLPAKRTRMEAREAEAEASVLYVGATRSRRIIRVRSGLQTRFGRLISGRVFHETSRRRIQFEIGLEGDLVRESPVSARFVPSEEDALKVQAWLRRSPAHAGASARLVKNEQYEYALSIVGDPEMGGLTVGGLSSGLVGELRAIARCRNAKSLAPPFINHLTIYGVRTVALSVEHPELGRIHGIFQKTGMFLAPLVKGLSICKLVD